MVDRLIRLGSNTSMADRHSKLGSKASISSVTLGVILDDMVSCYLFKLITSIQCTVTHKTDNSGFTGSIPCVSLHNL